MQERTARLVGQGDLSCDGREKVRGRVVYAGDDAALAGDVRGVMTREGVATFSTATEENGAGTATVMEQIAADALGLAMRRVRWWERR